jgi:hypothetical protein
MDGFDVRMQKLAQRQIEKRGKTITYSIVTTGAYNPATGSAPTVIVTAQVKAVVTNAGSGDLIAGTLVEQNEKSITIAKLSLAGNPSPNDNLTIDGQKYLVTSADANYAGEAVATYSISARKA